MGDWFALVFLGKYMKILSLSYIQYISIRPVHRFDFSPSPLLLYGTVHPIEWGKYFRKFPLASPAIVGPALFFLNIYRNWFYLCVSVMCLVCSIHSFNARNCQAQNALQFLKYTGNGQRNAIEPTDRPALGTTRKARMFHPPMHTYTHSLCYIIRN